MAALEDLRKLFDHSDLLEKVEAAVIISANNLVQGTPSLAEKQWAATVATAPVVEAKKALMFMLAENSGLTTTQIIGAGDPAIQANVDAVIGILVDAMSGV